MRANGKPDGLLPGWKRDVKRRWGVTGLLAFGLLFPSGLAVASPEEDTPVVGTAIESAETTAPDAVVGQDNAPTDALSQDSQGVVANTDVPTVAVEALNPNSDDQIVEFADARLKECVAGQLTSGPVPILHQGDPITVGAMHELHGLLSCRVGGIVDITPLQYAVNLGSLDLSYNSISDITVLAQLTGLSSLYMEGNQIVDLTPLAGLTNLSVIGLNENQIGDITPLSGLSQLQSLFLSWNQVADLAPLKDITTLNWVEVIGNQITDLTPLERMIGEEGYPYLDASSQRVALPDAVSGGPSALPQIRVLDGSDVEASVYWGKGSVDGDIVTWDMAEGGEGRLRWSYESKQSGVVSFSGIMTQKVLPAPKPVPDGDHLVLRSANLYSSRFDLSTGPFVYEVYYGRPDDEAFFGDWDGDGVDGVIVRRGNTFYVKNRMGPGTADRIVSYGRPGDEVLVGDWDGDGVDGLAVRRGNTYFINNDIASGSAEYEITYGRPDDVVLVGDWDGDGVDTLAVRRGNMYFFGNSMSGEPAGPAVTFGEGTDEVFVGDWDNDGVDSPIIRRGNEFLVFNAFDDSAVDTTFNLGNGSEKVYVAWLRWSTV